MKKEFSLMELRGLSFELSSRWEEYKDQIKFKSVKQLYNFINLKKKIEKEAEIIQESIVQIMTQNGLKPLEDGNFQIPEDKREIINKAFNELGESKVIIEATGVILNEEDQFPATLLDLLFDFIKMD